jgi:selenocysteine lyase/cysteine desulfurase
MEAVNNFASQCTDTGAQRYAEWMQVERHLRDQLANLINAPAAGDIALLKNTSEALSVVAHGFPWQPGDNVVICDEEFPSNRIVWESLARYGVSVRQVSVRDAAQPERNLMAATDAHTRLLSVSSVQYGSGLRLDLALLGGLCKEKGIAFCVDAIQGLGAIHHDVQAMRIDFLMADGHKWLLGPEGVAVFYCSASWRDRLKLHQYGWHMTEDYLNFDRRDWHEATSARRFECGSPNMLGIHALSASLSLLIELGINETERRILTRTEHLFAKIKRHPGLELVTPTTTGRYAGIVTFRHKNKPAAVLFKHLLDNKVICAPRGGGIRFSPHCYTRLETLDNALGLIS